MSIRWFAWLVSLAAASVCAIAQTAPAIFELDLGGRQIGKADYLFSPTKTGFHVKAHYLFTIEMKTVTSERNADLGPGYELRSDNLRIAVNGQTQSATITADPRTSRLTFEGETGGNPVTTTFEMHPGTVVFNNFDPSGVQNLIYMETAHPQPDHQYWGFLAQRKGVQLPMELTTGDLGEGTLKGTSIHLKRWHLKIAGAEGDIWADTNNNLMEFDIPMQSLSYRRSGFTLNEEQQSASAGPIPGAASVVERNVSFTSDGLKIPAILALPRDRKAPVPIVVLVQGSGPHDADETIGPNKPFRDIAYGLAADGIATLRYEKRTHLAPETFRLHPDLDHEVTIDAVAALAFASSQPEIDPRRVFLLGHSLGGTMAPVIAADRLQQAPGSVRGIIFLAGGALGVEETLMRQLLGQGKRQGEEQSQIEALEKQWQDIFRTINDPTTPVDEMVGTPPIRMPEVYWRSWISQNPPAELAKLGLPALVLRGTKDIQVSERDFQALAGANTAPGGESKQIEGLNHLMMPVAGESTGREYFQPSHVAPEAIQLISGWIGTFH